MPDTTRTGCAVTRTLSAKVEALDLDLEKRFSGATDSDAAYGGAGRGDAGFGPVRAGLNDRS